MPVCKSHSSCCQTIDVWSRNLTALRVVTLDVPIAEVISENNEDIGLRGVRCLDSAEGCEQEKGEEGGLVFHEGGVWSGFKGLDTTFIPAQGRRNL